MTIRATAKTFLALSLLLGTTTYPFCSGLTQLRKVHTEEVDTEGGKGSTPLVVSPTDTSRALTDDDSTCLKKVRLKPNRKGSFFGTSLDLDGDFLIVEDQEDAGNNRVYILRRDEDGQTWWRSAYYIFQDYVRSVAVSGDRALVGGESGGKYSVHIFVRRKNSFNRWSRETVLTEPSGAEYFGASCALNGNIVVVGTSISWSSSGKGAAYVYERDETNGWSGPKQLRPNDVHSREDGDQFGRTVAVHGDRVIVGAPGVDSSFADDTGAAYVFVRDATGAWIEEAKLTAGDGFKGDEFGKAVAIHQNVAIVGAPKHQFRGTVYVYVNGQNGWEERGIVMAQDVGARGGFGHAVAIDGDKVVIGAEDQHSGAKGFAALFSIDHDGELTLVTELVPTEPSSWAFGDSVGISGTTIVVGEAWQWWRKDETGSVHTFESCGI